MSELYWDPYDEDIEVNPYETWRRMRDEAPVYRNEKHDFYALTRFADVEVRAWRMSVRDVVESWQRIVLVDAPLSPFKTGRQPSRADRTPADTT